MSEGKEYTTTIRLPKVQEEYVKFVKETYGFSCNDLVKMSLLLHQTQFFKSQNDINLISPIVSKPEKPKKSKRYQNDTTSDIKLTPPSRAPSIMSLHKDIYKIDNNNIVFFDNDLNEAWLSYLRFRKESKKTVRPSQIPYMKNNIDKVIEAEGEAGLLKRFHASVANGWQGFVFNNEELGKRTTNEHEFTEDDL
jgi:hypothetical protein